MGCLITLLTAPFRLAIRLISFIIGAAGRLLALLIGLVLCALGVGLCLTGLGAIVGVPLVVFGGGLMFRSIF